MWCSVDASMIACAYHYFEVPLSYVYKICRHKTDTASGFYFTRRGPTWGLRCLEGKLP